MPRAEKDTHFSQFYFLFELVFRDLWWGSKALPGNVLGIPLSAWMALKRNIDARWFLLESEPAMIERYLSTYNLEGSFSALVQQIGYKPTAR
eukprot:3933338-Rhodomonas_salina.1